MTLNLLISAAVPLLNTILLTVIADRQRRHKAVADRTAQTAAYAVTRAEDAAKNAMIAQEFWEERARKFDRRHDNGDDHP